MKYIVIYNLGDNSLTSAYAFDNHDDAVDYVNECSEVLDDRMLEIVPVGDEKYEMTFKNGSQAEVEIKEYPDNKVRFDVRYDKNGRHVVTKRFSKRELAEDYANSVLEELNCAADVHEEYLGEWSVDDPNRNLTAHIAIKLVIVGERGHSDYQVLGLKDNATKDEAKKAFRQLAIKYHPDRGGDQKKFEEIHNAYERIMDGSATSGGAQKIKESYANIDMLYLLDNFDRIKLGVATEKSPEFNLAIEQVRSHAGWTIVKGILELIIGGILTAASYDAAPSGGTYTIFTGLIVLGIYNFFKGFVTLMDPESVIKNKKL